MKTIPVTCPDCHATRDVALAQTKRSKYTGRCTICNRLSHKGNGNPNWKGGRQNQGEYWYLHVPDHPAADKEGRVLEHRIVAERIIGRYLVFGETVHHLDGNPKNNKQSNIIVLPNQSSHAKLHKNLEAREKQTHRLVCEGLAEWLDAECDNEYHRGFQVAALRMYCRDCMEQFIVALRKGQVPGEEV